MRFGHFPAISVFINLSVSVVCRALWLWLWLSFKVWGECSGLSMNILHAGNKSPMQRGFVTNSTGNLLPTLGFLGRQFNFCSFVFIFSLIKSRWYVEVATYFTDLEMIEYCQKTCGWNGSLWKLKTT